MKYWKGKVGTIKENQFGTFEDNGKVPDSEIITKLQYDELIELLPEIPVKRTLKEILLAKGTITQLEFNEVK